MKRLLFSLLLCLLSLAACGTSEPTAVSVAPTVTLVPTTAPPRDPLPPSTATPIPPTNTPVQVGGHAFADNKFLVQLGWGLQNWPLDFLMEHPLGYKQDAENHIARLSSLNTWPEQVIEGLERGEQAGAILPKFVLEDTIAQLDAILNMQDANPAPADQNEV